MYSILVLETQQNAPAGGAGALVRRDSSPKNETSVFIYIIYFDPNLYEFLSSAEHKRWYLEECQ